MTNLHPHPAALVAREDVNQLDVLNQITQHIVLFYDEGQRVTSNDITNEEFINSITNRGWFGWDKSDWFE